MAQNALPEEYGQFLTVKDVKERLIQDANPLTLFLWPPNLFAFTSYVLHLSGAYQLVVSPPPGDKDLNHWPPKVALLRQVLGRLPEIAKEGGIDRRELTAIASACDEQLAFAQQRRAEFKTIDEYTPWTFMVRWAALEWRTIFDGMTDCEAFLKRLERGADNVPEAKSLITKFPPLLRACWEIFTHLYALDSQGGPACRRIETLLCNDSTGPRQDVIAWHAATCLLTMHAIADDASVGWGILEKRSMRIDFPDLEQLNALSAAHRAGKWDRRFRQYTKTDDRFHQLKDSPASDTAARRLKGNGTTKGNGTMATIEQSRSRILPKRHNPDVGITLRSLSSNLAFHHSPIEVKWERDGSSDLATRLSDELSDPKHQSKFTMLLLPWPMQVDTKDFKVVSGDRAYEAIDNRKGYGFFQYLPRENRTRIVQEIRAVIERTREQEDSTVDFIVLPESALGSNECGGLEEYLERDRKPGNGFYPVSAFIAGVNVTGRENEQRFDCNNTVRYGYWNREKKKFEGGFQHKHHRWQLSESQIEQYGLSQKLDVGTKWWEAINVERRHVSFVNIGDGITLCPLICEDLARQDPIADLIRQVGPSLVVTILMDGPQHKDRWSARYASILSEDPGSAVLALTSFGMVRRWNTRFGHISRVVALWNDKKGSREIELEAGATGILLTLKVESETEVIADGRRELCPTAKITLTDVNQIYDATISTARSNRSHPSRKKAMGQGSRALKARSRVSATSENR